MDRLNNANTLDILKFIVRHDKIRCDTSTIIITG